MQGLIEVFVNFRVIFETRYHLTGFGNHEIQLHGNSSDIHNHNTKFRKTCQIEVFINTLLGTPVSVSGNGHESECLAFFDVGLRREGIDAHRGNVGTFSMLR